MGEISNCKLAYNSMTDYYVNDDGSVKKRQPQNNCLKHLYLL